jgi:TetR/AcrR family transcriptional repressor of nem operon
VRYPAEETAAKHMRIVKVASKLYREHGLDGVSVGEIMKASGLTHGPFYNHFENKQALISECIDQISNQAVKELRQVPATETGKVDYCDGYLSKEHRDNVGEGCVIAALASEASRQPSARSALTRHVHSMVSAMASHFPWTTRRKARSESIRALATMVGALILARGVEDAQLSDEILREARL